MKDTSPILDHIILCFSKKMALDGVRSSFLLIGCLLSVSLLFLYYCVRKI